MDTVDPGVRAVDVSRRVSVVAGFYRIAVIDSLLTTSPVEHVRRPPVPPESPTLGLSTCSSRPTKIDDVAVRCTTTTRQLNTLDERSRQVAGPDTGPRVPAS